MFVFQNLFHFFLALPKANATSILLFLFSMAALRISTSIMINYKHSPIAFPMEVLLVSDLQNVIVIIELTECVIYYISKNISHITSGCCYIYRLSLCLSPLNTPTRSTVFRCILHSCRSKCCIISGIAFCFLSQIITVTIVSNCIHLHAESSNAVLSMIPQRLVVYAVNEVVLWRYKKRCFSLFLKSDVG